MEQRQMLAADMAEIVGVVRLDLQGDGNAANDAHVAGAQVTLYRDNGNGVLDAGDVQAASAVALEALTSIRRSRVDGMLKQLAVDGAAERAGSGWVATGEPWVFAVDHYEGVVATRRREADIMRRRAFRSRYQAWLTAR